jgi:hypothetical protein
MDQGLAERLDRIESSLALQQLPIRYALAVDGRDIDAWIGLFTKDVDCGRYGTGREALRTTIEPPLTGVYRTMHQICGHEFHFLDADHAAGHVYCRAEHEIGDEWMVMGICYFDDYVRQDGEWFFRRRKERHWYAVDLRDGPPQAPFGPWRDHAPPSLPASFPTWAKFWEKVPEAEVATITKDPLPTA